MRVEKLETEMAMESTAGRESLAVWHRTVRSLSGPEKVAKAFELTETTRQFMRAGIRARHPEATESELQNLYVDRLLQFHGTSLAEIRQKQRDQASR